MYLLATFILQKKILKKLLELIQGYEMHHFRVQNSPFVINKTFLLKIIIIAFIYLLTLFIVQNFLKILQRILSCDHFWAQNGPFASNKFLLGKLLISFSS